MRQVIQTARLTLRPVDVQDRLDLISLERDPEIMLFLNGGRPTPEDGIDPTAGFLMPRGGEAGIWCMRRTPNGVFTGWASLLVGEESSAELGYRLRRDAWGYGFASEAALALIAHGFDELGVLRIVATTMAVNARSRRVMEKAGLVHVDTQFMSYSDPLPGTEHGEVVYEITREAWRLRQSPSCDT